MTWPWAQDTLHEVSWQSVAGVGRPAWGLPHFCPNLQMLLLGSSNYQNLWNLLMLVKIIVIWFQKHEIQRNVSRKNHRNRPPTPTYLICPRSIDLSRCMHPLVSTSVFHGWRSMALDRKDSEKWWSELLLVAAAALAKNRAEASNEMAERALADYACMHGRRD